MIGLGNKVKDTMTGYEGIAIARTEWLYGCARLGVQAQELKDGKTIEPEWFDEQRLVVIVDSAPEVSPDSSAKSGGPQSDPRPQIGR